MESTRAKWMSLRYGLGAMRKSLENTRLTTNDVLSDLEVPDERFTVVFAQLKEDLDSWIRAMDENIRYCKTQE